MGKNKLAKKISVTLGIPAYNEEENIRFLLDSIIQQKTESYILEKIIVISDGSTDKTAKRVREIKRTSPPISLLEGKKQLGKKARLLQLYKLNQSDILVTCDGDVVLKEPYVIEKLIQHFDTDNVVMVSGNNQPVRAENFVGKLINQWAQIWYETRSIFKNGHNIHNVRGTLMALRKSFAKGIKFDGQFVSDAQFIYFESLRQRLEFRFAKDALVLYRKPSNIYEYLLQTRRDPNGRKKIAEFFGKWIYKEYRIPVIYKIRALLKMFTLNPILTTLALIFYLTSEFCPHKINISDKPSLWKSSRSTKKGINLPAVDYN